MSNKRISNTITNLILNTDSYKASHFEQYPDGTEFVYSYVESRGGVYPRTLFFGLQAFIKEYLQTPITMEDIEQAEKFLALHGEPFNKEGWMGILKDYDGYLPIRIDAVEEGTMVPTSNVLVSVINTDPKYAWVTSYIETALLRGVWYPTTVATQSKYAKNAIQYALEDTGTPEAVGFKLHDFGARGVSSLESARLGGMAHLVNFMGTDTISGILAAQEYYGPDDEMMGFSIPAAEHSTITIMGREGETAQYKRMLDKFAKPGSLVAIVADSYDIFEACRIFGEDLKQQILDSGATVIIRPDSGDPITVPLQVVKELEKYFGSTMNSKGYKVLNTVRVIQGDGINADSLRRILQVFEFNGYSADNLAFGMGGGLLQQVNRDTQKFAMKASAARINGVWFDVFKDPVTDSGKRSKRGQVKSYRSRMTGEWMSFAAEVVDSEWEPMMTTVFENGRLLKDMTFAEVRTNSNKW